MSFKFLNQNPDGLITDDCTVRAISLFTGKSWDSTFIGIAITGFERKRMMSTNYTWQLYLRNLGYKQTSIPNFCPECYTIKEFCKDNPKGKFLLTTGTHVVTAIDGNYYDTWDSGDEVPISYWS